MGVVVGLDAPSPDTLRRSRLYPARRMTSDADVGWLVRRSTDGVLAAGVDIDLAALRRKADWADLCLAAFVFVIGGSLVGGLLWLISRWLETGV